MPPINPMKLGETKEEVFETAPAAPGLPWHIIEKPNDLFESQLTAPWWEA